MKYFSFSRFADFIWDVWCAISIVGIWPRFIEPKLLRTTRLCLEIPKHPPSANGIKILQLSDLHLHAGVSPSFLKRLKFRILQLEPDVIVFTGDFLCYGQMKQVEELKLFLSGLCAPYGCFAIFGNHDYTHFVSVNEEGEYDTLNPSESSLGRGLKRLFKKVVLQKRSTKAALQTPENAALIELLKNTPFQILNNKTIQLEIRNSRINLTGLGEYMLGKCLPDVAFKDYDKNLPGVILLHNPDAIPLLRNYPGDIVLCGHTHGGQVYLPKLWKKFALMENQNFLRGLKHAEGKTIYINSGVGSVLPFRFFAPPEILLLTLTGSET